MKKYIAGLLLLLTIAACKKDNYDAPNVTFNGRITYQGEPIGVASQQVYFELWQTGFGKLTPINVNINQDGNFSALLFSGTYKMDLPVGQGPYLPASGHYGDTSTITITGSNTMNIEVLPYFMIRDDNYSLADSVITATFRLDSIVKDPALAKAISEVSLYESTLDLLDAQNNKVATTLSGANITGLQQITLTLKVPPDQYVSQSYIFARIGVRLAGIDDMLYAAVVKINL
ncbi:Protein of unknown function [Chitinophaga costaii]|uniref:DUF3823 domain-containing protein n=1 Tax=Chitinophaga costaii TaxID=1335309 RepID=A0A1C4DTX4_9BACT|nr:DUF3823 domain-containing protein [Chitinophaga costaii]PUZ27792.1 DUF3823 domain-containing protein [Chitinophaga costaii]SCC34844.1 Protein of unknown function [Chitinophaga costaii]